jgi:hypothetical protein
MTRTNDPLDALSSVTESPLIFAIPTWVPFTATLAGPLKAPTLADAGLGLENITTIREHDINAATTSMLRIWHRRRRNRPLAEMRITQETQAKCTKAIGAPEVSPTPHIDNSLST